MPKRRGQLVRRSAAAGWTIVEIMIVVVIIGFLAAITIPNFIRARSNSNEKTCLNNLRQIDGCAQMWAAENNRRSSDSYTLDDIKGYLRLNRIPECPSGGQYGPTFTVGTAPTCNVAGHMLQ